jgi:hypothetical protein
MYKKAGAERAKVASFRGKVSSFTFWHTMATAEE